MKNKKIKQCSVLGCWNRTDKELCWEHKNYTQISTKGKVSRWRRNRKKKDGSQKKK